MILGTMDDVKHSADLALHFWYSSSLLTQQQISIAHIIPKVLALWDRDGSVALGKYSKMSSNLHIGTKVSLALMYQNNHSIDAINAQLRRVRWAVHFNVSLIVEHIQI